MAQRDDNDIVTADVIAVFYRRKGEVSRGEEMRKRYLASKAGNKRGCCANMIRAVLLSDKDVRLLTGSQDTHLREALETLEPSYHGA